MRTRKHTPTANLVKDLIAVKLPRSVERSESIRVTALRDAIAAGRLSLADARAQHRGDA